MREGMANWRTGAATLAILLSLGDAAAQKVPAVAKTIPLTVKPGVPIRVELVKSVRIKKVGAPLEGRVVEPVYVFDQMVIPAGSQIRGRVVKIDPIPRGRRARAIANANFTPFHHATFEFDTLRLKDGERLGIDTTVSPAAQNVVRLVAGGAKKKKEGRAPAKAAEVRRQIEQRKSQTLAAIKSSGRLKWIKAILLAHLPYHREIQTAAAAKSPGRLERIKAFFSAQLPYHRQVLAAGTRFTVELNAPLNLGRAEIAGKELERVGGEIPPSSDVRVWLKTPLSSATDHKGTPVEAVVSQPVFTADHRLILPVGSRLKGRVITARPARRLGRNGQLRFGFQQIVLPKGTTRAVEAGLQAAEVPSSSHLKLDAEGGAHGVSSKTRFVMPAIDVLLATSSVADSDSRARQIQEGSGNPGQVAGGGVRGAAGFGLIGTVVGAVAHSRPVSSGFALYGAAWSVYSHLLTRGHEVAFPQYTAMDVRFGSHEGARHPASPAKERFTSSLEPAKGL
jgi:hypothetical protein